MDYQVWERECVCVCVREWEWEWDRGNCEPEAITYSLAMETWTNASIRWFDTKKDRKNIMLGRLSDLTDDAITEFSTKNQLKTNQLLIKISMLFGVLTTFHVYLHYLIYVK